MRSEDGISVELALADDSGRRIDSGPEGVAFGAVCLGRWHVHPVVGADAVFAGMAAHLVKINYDLHIDPGAPVVRWFEVLFALPESGSTIVAAVPRGAAERRPAASYALSRNLEFVPVDSGAASVHVPPTEGPVHAYGASGNSIRWLHVAEEGAGVRPGSYSAWIVLLVPAEKVEQEFRLTARFDPEPVEGDNFRQLSKSAEFSVSLAPSAWSSELDVKDRSGPGFRLPDASPRIFVCYVHEDEVHKKKVRSFVDLLRENGLDPRLDKDQEGPRVDWEHWALREIRDADFVFVIASPTCRAVGEGTYAGSGHPGIRSELAVIRNLLQKYPRWASHVLPVVLPGCSVDDIPMFLQPVTMDHYKVEALIRSEIEGLLKAIDSTSPWQGWDQW